MRTVVSIAIVLLLGITVVGIVSFGQINALHKLMTTTIVLTSHTVVSLIGLLIVLIAPRPTWSGQRKVAGVLIGAMATAVFAGAFAIEWGILITNFPVSDWTLNGLILIALADGISLLINIT